MSAKIIGSGVSIPQGIMTNADLEKIVDTTDQWITERTGIRERHIIDEKSAVSDLAAEAGSRALADAGLHPDEIDLYIVATASPEKIWPSTACLMQSKMGLSGKPAFDIQAACTGFVYALSVADALIKAKSFKRILLVGAEAMSRLVDWGDRKTCILFGDGAGAWVLTDAAPGKGVISSYINADSSGHEMLHIPAGGSGMICSAEVAAGRMQTIKMNGNDVFRFAVRKLPESVMLALDKAGLGVGDIDYFIPHQANSRIIDSVIERLGLPKDRVIGNIAKYGNTSTASIPLAFDEVYRSGKLKDGDIIVTAAVGAGLTWGANVIRWGG